jgi:hypothetical protein
MCRNAEWLHLRSFDGNVYNNGAGIDAARFLSMRCLRDTSITSTDERYNGLGMRG